MNSPHRNRSLARRLALQALYQQQLNPLSWQDTRRQFAEDPEAERVDREYFEELVAAIAPNGEALDREIAKYSEIAPGELDPIEHAVLWLGLHELAAHFVAGKRTVKALVYIIFLLGALTTIAAGAVTLFHRGGN